MILALVLIAQIDDVFTILEEEETVISVSRAEEKRSETTLTVEIITADDIRNSGVEMLPELLKRYAGLDVTQTTFSDFHVSIRGQVARAYEPDKVMLLFDGRPATNDAFGNIPWNAISIGLDVIERIEIVRGPGTSIYGGIGVVGVVNIISKPVKNRPAVALEVAGGAYAWGRVWPAFRYNASQAVISDNGKHEVSFAMRALAVDADVGLGRRELRVPQASSTLSYGYRVTNTQRFALSFWGAGNARNYVRSTLDQVPHSDQGAFATVSAEYFVDAKDAGDWSLQARVTGQRFITAIPEQVNLAGDLQALDLPLPFNILSELIVRTPLPGKQTLTAGADFRTFILHGGAVDPAARLLFDASAFAIDQVRLFPWWVIDVALRAGTRAYASGAVPARALISPRIGMAFPIHPHHTLRLSASYSQRPASPMELFSYDRTPYSLPGNPALRPEGVGQIDLGYTLRIGAFEGNFTPFIAVYHSLRERTETLPSTLENQSTATGYGGEVAASFKPTEGVVVRGNYSLALFRSQGQPYAAGAPHKFNVTADAELPFGLGFNAAIGFVSQADYVGQTPLTYPLRVSVSVPDRAYIDASVRFRHPTGFNLQLTFTNITALRAEYPSIAAQAIGPRVMLAAGYAAPTPFAGRNEWHDRWYTQALWAAGTILPTLILALVPQFL